MKKIMYKRKKIMAFLKKNREEGFSLVEVLITFTILATVLVGVLSAFIYGFNAISRIKHVAYATQAVQEELELIRNMSFDEIVSLDLETSFTNDSLSLLENGSGTLSIEDSLSDDIKKITISVNWTHQGREIQRDMVTYITKEGINKK